MLLNEQDKMSYLTNVLLVAFADKKLSAQESSAVEEIRKNIDAKRGTLASAQKAVESGSYTFSKVGSFADQVHNIEDMLFVALADSELASFDSELVGHCCNLIGLYQDQVDRLVSDASRRCATRLNSIVCPACAAIASPQSRFCPSCGKPFETAEPTPVQLGFEIPIEGYAIEFCESTASNFAMALELAKTTASMQTIGKNKKTWYLAAFSTNNFDGVVALASALSGLRNRRIYFNGKDMIWDEVFGFTWCASRRATAYRPVEYCFGKDENRVNPWGCKQSRFEWTEWAAWFSYGHWEKASILRRRAVFVFDKQRIQHELATALYRFRFCPHMRPQLVEAVLRHFPDRVEPTPNGDWKYNHAYEEVPGAIKVIEREGSDEFAYNTEYFSDGVRPRGHKVLADILKKAFKDCGVSDLGITSLLTK